MKEKDIQTLIGLGVNKIIMRKEEYDKLSNETKNLIKLNDVNLKIIGSENNGRWNKRRIRKIL